MRGLTMRGSLRALFTTVVFSLAAVAAPLSAQATSVRGIAGATTRTVKKTAKMGEAVLKHTAVRHPFATAAVYAPAEFAAAVVLANKAHASPHHALVIGGLFAVKAVGEVIVAKYAHDLVPKTMAALKRIGRPTAGTKTR
jgi:hypothetical protein